MAYTLPYPNIVFVPLDVLTAEELNQIVANTEGLASQITSASRTINVIDFGNRKIMWGSITTTSIPSGSEQQFTVKFPQLFTNAPTVVATCSKWVGQPRVIVGNITTSEFKIILGHSQGNNQTMSAFWIAIG